MIVFLGAPLTGQRNAKRTPTPSFQKKGNREPRDGPQLGQIWNQLSHDSLGCHTLAPHTLVSRSEGKEKNAFSIKI